MNGLARLRGLHWKSAVIDTGVSAASFQLAAPRINAKKGHKAKFAGSVQSVSRHTFPNLFEATNRRVFARSITNVAQSNVIEEEIGKKAPPSLKVLYSAHHTFTKGEMVVVKQSCGNSFFGRVEATYLPSSLNRHAEYVICVDEVNSVFLREPPELLGKILTVASDMDEFTQREKVYPPPAIMKGAHVNSMQEYRRLYRESIDNPQAFWSDISAGFHWETPWHTLNNVNFDLDQGPIKIEWFVGGKTNLSYNCVDRHVLAGKGDRIAFIWEGNDGERSTMSYRELLEAVSRFANVLKSHGVKRGDMITIYLPMVCELPVAMLACARIGAVHSVVFGGFSSEALSTRIVDSKSKVLITADGVMRGAKVVPFKQIADTAVAHARELGQSVEHCIIVRRLGEERAPLGEMPAGYALWDELVAKASPECPVEWLDSEAPAFLLYTSGSTGKPKGIIHTTGGYMVYAATTFKNVFDYREGDVYWCTADCGWITGHSYITYGPTANCATQVLFEGVPTHPTASKLWEIVQAHGVTQLYTSPTAIRSLMALGNEPVRPYNLSTLRVLGSVGEPINPEAWRWYHNEVGGGKRPIVDTWWQTETGGIMLTPLPGATPLKPGSATLPYFGVEPVLLDELGNELGGPGTGYLAIRQSWPGQARGVHGDPARFEGYFNLVNAQNAVISRDKYITGDACRRDGDGYYWITGRIDDVINVSGHRVETAEVESALVVHPKCAEAAVVGVPHSLKGESIYAFVTLMDGLEMTPELRKELKQTVRKEIGAFAVPDVVHWAPGLPKTRSGKILRRVLRRIANGLTDASELGDVSTMADPAVVAALIKTGETAS